MKKLLIVSLFALCVSTRLQSAAGMDLELKTSDLNPFTRFMLSNKKVTATIPTNTTLKGSVDDVVYTVTVWGTERTQIGIRLGDEEFIYYADAPGVLNRVQIWNRESLRYELSEKGADYSLTSNPPDEKMSAQTAESKWQRLKNHFVAIHDLFDIKVSK